MSIRDIAQHIHQLGANITAIEAGTKKPKYEWNNPAAPWAITRQPRGYVKLLDWPTESTLGRGGRITTAIDAVGIVNGAPTDDGPRWRHIDVDGVLTSDGKDKHPVPDKVRTALLGALGLDAGYEWARPSRRQGVHIWVRCEGDMPADIAESVSKTKANEGGGTGVKVGKPLPEYADAFSQIELRYERCQSVLAPSNPPFMPVAAPAIVSMAALEAALRSVATFGTLQPATQPATPTNPYAPNGTRAKLKTDKSRIDKDATERAIDAAFDSVDWFVNEYAADIEDAPRNEIRILGRQGLLVEANRQTWYSHSLEDGGGWVKAVALTRFNGTVPSGADYFALLTVAADFCGVTPALLPTAQPATGTATLPGPVASLADALESNGYVYSFETETSTYYLNGKPRTDHEDALVLSEVIDKNLGKARMFDLAVKLLANRHKFARIADTLRGLAWDGGDHIGALATCLLTHPHEVIRYQDGTTKRAALAFLTRWLVGAVRKVLYEDENLVLVLAGAQDAGKSYLVKWLGSVVPGSHYEGAFSPEDKDTALRMLKCFVWELAELDGITSKHAAASMKMLITLRTVQARPAYGRHDISGTVRTSFVGSVNDNGDGFLNDPTGNRRYMVIPLTGLDISYSTKLDVKQVWAHAVHLALAGATGRPCEEERTYRDTMNAARFESKGTLSDFVHEYFEPATGDGLLSNVDVYLILQAHRASLRIENRRIQSDISAALERLGAIKTRFRVKNRSTRGWRGIAETQASILARKCGSTYQVGPDAGGMPLGTVALDEWDNLTPNEVVTEVVTEVVPPQQDALNGHSVTTVTTNFQTFPNSDISNAATSEKAHVAPEMSEFQKVSTFAGTLSQNGRLARQDACDNLRSEVVTEVVTGKVVTGKAPLFRTVVRGAGKFDVVDTTGATVATHNSVEYAAADVKARSVAAARAARLRTVEGGAG